MSKYIVTYTKRTHFNGNEPKHIKCNTLKEVKYEIFKLKKNLNSLFQIFKYGLPKK